MPYPLSAINVVENIWSTSTSTSVLLANLPLIRGLVSAYAFLDAYLIVFSNFLVFFFSLYLRTLASLSIGVSWVGIWIGGPEKRSIVPLGGLGCEIEIEISLIVVASGTTPTSIDDTETWIHHNIEQSVFSSSNIKAENYLKWHEPQELLTIIYVQKWDDSEFL